MSDELLIELNDIFGEFGLVYVYLRNGNYVLVNFGILIFDVLEFKKELGFWVCFFFFLILFVLMKFDDYVFFDKEWVLIEGFFDNIW